MHRAIAAVAILLAVASAPLTCAGAASSPSPVNVSSASFVDAGLVPAPKGRHLLDGGSLRLRDGAVMLDGPDLPDSLTPRMTRDASAVDGRFALHE